MAARPGIRPGRIALIGDSAGGFAATTILRAREQGLALPAATIPFSPWLDMDETGETFETNAARGPGRHTRHHPNDGRHIPWRRWQSPGPARQSVSRRP
jgi:acetyl esterase/lipase